MFRDCACWGNVDGFIVTVLIAPPPPNAETISMSVGNPSSASKLKLVKFSKRDGAFQLVGELTVGLSEPKSIPTNWPIPGWSLSSMVPVAELADPTTYTLFGSIVKVTVSLPSGEVSGVASIVTVAVEAPAANVTDPVWLAVKSENALAVPLVVKLTVNASEVAPVLDSV